MQPNNRTGGGHQYARVRPRSHDAAWASIEQFIPRHVDNHPKGGHRPRIDDRTCFTVVHVRLTTGCSWVDAERICGGRSPIPPSRERHSLWVDAGVFKRLRRTQVAPTDHRARHVGDRHRRVTSFCSWAAR
ncbi:MAG: transposase [Candidatus Microthrix sp.]|nr:transposase [Candidatus Microthrix sp.]